MQIQNIELNLDNKDDYSSCIGKLTGIKDFVRNYPDDIRKDQDFSDSALVQIHIPGILVLQHERSNGKLLYLTSAYGIGIKIFGCLGYDTIGLDIKKISVKESAKRGLNAIVGDALDIPFKNESFDITISKDFLREDYLSYKGIAKCLIKQYRVLKKGGIAISYSLLFDTETTSIGRLERLSLEKIDNSPFKELRRYTLNYKDKMIQYVDVFEK